MNSTEGYDKAKWIIRQALQHNPDQLYLDGLELTHLPPELSELTSITHLNLENNNFETLPDVLLKLPQLKSIYVEYNPLKILPDWIGELTQLEGLNFYECELSEIPDSIGQLINLDHLALDRNLLKTLPETFGNLAKLESVGLYGNYFEKLPETFGNLKSLVSVCLIDNQLRTLPESFAELTALEDMDLKENQLLRLPKDLDKLSNLKAIQLSNNPITELPENLPTLEFLDISYCPQITYLPATLKVTNILKLGGQKLTSIPDGCKQAKLTWDGIEVEERIIIHPETISAEDVLTAKDHFAREVLLNLMAHDQFLREIHTEKIDEVNREKETLTLMRIIIPNSETETYLIILDKHHKNHKVQWVLPKFQNCQEAYDWRNRKWEDV